MALDRAGQRIAAEGAKRTHLVSRCSPGRSVIRSSSRMMRAPSRSITGRGAGEIERHDRYVFLRDVVPDISLGPVRERKDAKRFAGSLAGVEQAPEFGSLVRRIPACSAERKENTRSFARDLLLIAPRPAEGASNCTDRTPASAPRSSSPRCAAASPN